MDRRSRASNSAYVPHDLARVVPGVAGGPLAGFRAVVKDVFDIAGERTGAGSPEWLASAEPAETSATAVQRVLDAGATVVARTVCDELVYSIIGSNVHYGTPLNPRAPDRVPGGSSSGSASATAAGACDFALGTDTAGSIRVPAALCGVFGVRVSHGRVSTDGVFPMAPSFDSVGWLAPSAGVLGLVGATLLDGTAVMGDVHRIVVAEDLMQAADVAVQQVLTMFLNRASLGAVETVVAAGDDIGGWIECFRTIQAFETWRSFGGWVTAHAPSLGPGIAERVAYASTVTEAEVAAARELRRAIVGRLDALAGLGTVVILPTVPCPAPLRVASVTELEAFRTRTMAFTCIAGLAQRPQVSLPAGLAEGAPVGLSLLGWPGGDEALLDLAAALAVHCAG